MPRKLVYSDRKYNPSPGNSPIPERATAVDPEPKPPEAAARRRAAAVDGAGSSSEVAPAERASGCATTRPRPPGDTGKAGRAGGAGGSPVLCSDCPAPDYPTDRTRCEPCPRRRDIAEMIEFLRSVDIGPVSVTVINHERRRGLQHVSEPVRRILRRVMRQRARRG